MTQCFKLTLHVMIYTEKARVIERWCRYLTIVCKTFAWLVFISAANVVNFDFLKLLTDRFQVCRGARVIRILCTSMKTLCKCLVEVILS